MNDKQKELAARRLCESRGVDPDLMIAPNAKPWVGIGISPVGFLQIPAWRLALDEVEKYIIIKSAVESEKPTNLVK
jgi:hypothetical protein